MCNSNKSIKQILNLNINDQPGDEILILTNNFNTLQDHGIGPFTIIQVHTNGLIHFNPHHMLWNVLIFAESHLIGTGNSLNGEEDYIPRPLTLTR